jgi:hypothetical protein
MICVEAAERIDVLALKKGGDEKDERRIIKVEDHDNNFKLK